MSLKIHNRVKDYFIGDLIKEEKDTLMHANIVVIYYVMMLCLTLLVPLQFLYIYTGNMLQQGINIASIVTFILALIFIKRRKSVIEISHGLLVFSTITFSMNMFMYPHMNIINGLLLACNIHFAFNLLGKKSGIVYSVIHFVVVALYMAVVAENIKFLFIQEIEQPVTEQISVFFLLFVIIVVLILHYQSSHQKAAINLIESIKALKVSEERRQKSQAVGHIGNWEVLLPSGELFWDDETLRIFGSSDHPPTCLEDVYKRIHPDDQEYVRQSIATALQGEPYNVDYRIIHASGVEKVVNALGEIQRDIEGRPLRFYGIVQDITERKRAEEEQKKLMDITSYQNTQLKNFAYIVSHNIRSHSANITSLVDFLERAKSEEERVMMLGMPKSTAFKLDDTLKNLNEIITVTENASKPKDRRDLKVEIFKTLDILNGTIYQHKVAVEVDVPSEQEVNVIPSYLDSILLNLLSNAIKYRASDRDARVHISAKRADGYTILSVKDNGMGIDMKKNANKVFGMYKTFHKNEDARGIGLFITKNHVDAMKGKIEVESEENVGTTFRVYFNEKD